MNPGTSFNIDWGQVGIAAAVFLAAFLHKWDTIKVKKALTTSNKERDVKLDAIHGLVNGNMSDQKRTTMILARRIAELTKNPADVAIAREAESDFLMHQNQIGLS